MFQVCNWADSCRKMTKFEISGSIYDWWAEACRSWPANYLIHPFSSFSNCLLAVSMAFLHSGHEICFILRWGTTSTSCINKVLHMWYTTRNNRINCFPTHATKLLLTSCRLTNEDDVNRIQQGWHETLITISSIDAIALIRSSETIR